MLIAIVIGSVVGYVMLAAMFWCCCIVAKQSDELSEDLRMDEPKVVSLDPPLVLYHGNKEAA